MNKSYLLFQPADLSADDVIVIDGHFSNDSKTCQKAFDEIYNLSKSVSTKNAPWQGRKGKYHFVKGLLDKIDEKGRRLSFIFIAKEECWKEQLDESIMAIGIPMDSRTIDILNKRQRFKCWTIVIMIIIITVVTITIFHTNNNKSNGKEKFTTSAVVR